MSRDFHFTGKFGSPRRLPIKSSRTNVQIAAYEAAIGYLWLWRERDIEALSAVGTDVEDCYAKLDLQFNALEGLFYQRLRWLQNVQTMHNYKIDLYNVVRFKPVPDGWILAGIRQFPGETRPSFLIGEDVYQTTDAVELLGWNSILFPY